MSDSHFQFSSNGYTPVLPRHLQAKYDHQAAVLEARTAVLKRMSAPPPPTLRESIGPMDLPDFGRTVADQMDLFQPGYQNWGYFFGGRSERKSGAQYPWLVTETHLDWMRSASRLVAGYNNGHGSGIIGGYCSYVIGKGMICKPVPVDGKNDPSDARLVKLIEREIQEFSDRVKWPEYQQQTFCGSMIDGDRGIWMFDLGDHVDIRPLYGEYLRQPVGGDYNEWGWGVHTPSDDPCHVLGYHVMEPTASEGQYVEESEIAYFPFWRPGGWELGIKRGMPFFAGANKEVIDASAKILRNMGTSVAIREAFAYIATLPAGMEREDTAEVIDFASDVKITRTPQENQYRYLTKVHPGMVPHLPEGYTYNAPPGHPGADAAINAVDAMIRSACASLNVPPWMGGASGTSQGAYASELVKEAPLVKTGEQRQEFYGNRFLKVCRKVVAVAVRCGRLPEECLSRIRLTMEYPSLESQDKGAKATRDQTYVGMGAKSIQQVQREENLDPDTMRADISEFNAWKAAEAAKAQALQPQGAEGTEPGKTPPLTPGISDDDSDPFGEVQEAIRGLASQVAALAESRAVVAHEPLTASTPLTTWAARIESASVADVARWAEAVGESMPVGAASLSEQVGRRVLGEPATPPVDIPALVESIASRMAPAAAPQINITPAPVMSRTTMIQRGPDGLVASVTTTDVLEDASSG